jgi:type VI secretion system secreted protein Hcp
MWKRITSLGLVAGLSLSTAVVSAAPSAYLKIKAQKQGDIKGGVTQKGREGSIEVDSTSHDIVSPRDAATGAATGKRQHKPLVVTIELDRALPQLYSALVNNEVLTTVELKFYRTGAAGTELQFYTVKLSNASIASIHFVQPNSKLPEQTRIAETAEVSFTYQKIEWTWTDGGVKAQDDWSAAR